MTRAWKELALSAIADVESAVRETDWGQPLFGPNAAEELRAQQALIETHERDGDCRNCAGTEWVCEDHLDRPWEGNTDHPDACKCGGAGAPCGVCNLEMASAGYVARAVNKALGK